MLAYVMVDSTSWMGGSAEKFADLPEIQDAHVIAGSASMLLKVRTTTTGQLQDVLRRLYAIDGVSGAPRPGSYWRRSSNGRSSWRTEYGTGRAIAH